jgi:hypothetical protein
MFNTRGIKMNYKAKPTHLVYEGPLGQIACQEASFCATKDGFPIGTFDTFEKAMEILAWKGRDKATYEIAKTVTATLT